MAADKNDDSIKMLDHMLRIAMKCGITLDIRHFTVTKSIATQSARPVSYRDIITCSSSIKAQAEVQMQRKGSVVATQD